MNQSIRRWLKIGFIVVSNAVIVIYLMIDGLTALDVIVYAAGESLLVACLFLITQGVHEYANPATGRTRPTLSRVVLNVAIKEMVTIVVFGGTMALFLGAILMIAPADQSVVPTADPIHLGALGSPAFMQAIGFVLLAVLGQFLMSVIDAFQGQPSSLSDLAWGVILHLLIGVVASTFGAAMVVLLGLPTFSLVALVILKAAADLVTNAMVNRSDNSLVL